jgi:hypothetical protein
VGWALKVGIVGSRVYPHEKHSDIARYVASLPEGTILVSGGAKGVDQLAESCHKGRVWSFRPKADPDKDSYGVELWDFGGKNPSVVFFDSFLADYKDACLYRDMLIAHECDELVAFWNGYSKGTVHTANFAKGIGKVVTFK